MIRYAILCLAAACAFAADDPWDKVRQLKSGAEVRIVKKGVKQPITAKFDEARDESVVVVIKNEQVAIQKEDIDRLDARLDERSRVKTETKSKLEGPDIRPAPPQSRQNAPRTTYSSGVSLTSRPDFETVYRRPQGPPPKQQ